MEATITRLGDKFSIQCPHCNARVFRNKGYFSDQQLSTIHQQPCPSCKKNYNVNLSFKGKVITAVDK